MILEQIPSNKVHDSIATYLIILLLHWNCIFVCITSTKVLMCDTSQFDTKLQSEAYNFTKRYTLNTPSWDFSTFLKLCKWYQIAQSVSDKVPYHILPTLPCIQVLSNLLQDLNIFSAEILNRKLHFLYSDKSSPSRQLHVQS